MSMVLIAFNEGKRQHNGVDVYDVLIEIYIFIYIYIYGAHWEQKVYMSPRVGTTRAHGIIVNYFLDESRRTRNLVRNPYRT